MTMLHKKVEKHKCLRQTEREVGDARIQELLIEVVTLNRKVRKHVMIGLFYVLVVVLYFNLF